MCSLIARIVGVVGAAIVSVTLFGNGVASADALIGLTYDQAVATIASKWNGKAVIGTVSGDQVPKEDCIVTSWQNSIFLDSDGTNSRKDEILLHLNCNNRLASPGHPGNSSMSPEGVTAKKDQEAAASINKDPEFCEESDEIAEWCQKVCSRTGLCEI